MADNRSKWFRMPVADRRKRVAELHAKGLQNIVIAKRLGIADTTVSQDLLALGLRTPQAVLDGTQCDVDWGSATKSQRCIKPEGHAGVHRDALAHEWISGAEASVPVFSLAEVYAAQRAITVDELMTPHGLAKLDQVSLQALFLDGLTPRQRGAMTGKAAAFTLAELSFDTLIAAILRQRDRTPAPAYPRVPAAGSAPARPPMGGARAGAAGASREDAGRPEPPDLGAGGAGKDTGEVARPEPARRAS